MRGCQYTATTCQPRCSQRRRSRSSWISGTGAQPKLALARSVPDISGGKQGRPSHRPSLLAASVRQVIQSVASGAPECLLRIGSVAGHYHNPFQGIWRFCGGPAYFAVGSGPGAVPHAIRSVISLPLLGPPLGTVPDRDKPAAICAFSAIVVVVLSASCREQVLPEVLPGVRYDRDRALADQPR